MTWHASQLSEVDRWTLREARMDVIYAKLTEKFKVEYGIALHHVYNASYILADGGCR